MGFVSERAGRVGHTTSGIQWISVATIPQTRWQQLRLWCEKTSGGAPIVTIDDTAASLLYWFWNKFIQIERPLPIICRAVLFVSG
jgi:hypothetical protein